MYDYKSYFVNINGCRILKPESCSCRKKIVGKETTKHADRVASVFVFLIVAYLIAALVQALLPFSFNRLIGAAIIIVLGYDYVANLNRGRIIASCLICILALINIGILTSNRSEEVEFYIYWIAALLTLLYIGSSDHVKSLRQVVMRNIGALRLVLVGSAIFVGALLISKTGYEASWGGRFYFVGFCNEEHTMASVCCLVMTLSLLCTCVRGLKPLAFGVIGVMSWALLETGARTFLVPAAVVWFFFIRNCIKWHWLRISLFFILGIVTACAFMSSGMSAKFDYLSTGRTGDSLLDALTSGRIAYWTTDLGAYCSGGPIVWLLGGSASSVYDLNLATFSMRIWAHNDFVMLLCSVGLVGTILYIITLRAFFIGFSRQLEKISAAFVALFVLFPAFFNGFYSYQHLLYASIFLISAISQNGDCCEG